MTEPAQPHAWEQTRIGWFIGAGLVWAGTVVLTVLDTGSTRQHQVALGALVALLAVYLLAGGRSLMRRTSRLTWLAAGASIVLIFIGVAAMPVVAVILFAAYPHLFAWLEPTRVVVTAVVLLSVAVGLGQVIATGWTLGSILGATATALVSMVFALAFGLWTERIMRQSVERADIIEQLRATQDQLTAVHHEAGVLKERQRLALEIHDTLAQGFTSLLMLSQAVRREMDSDPAAAQAHLDLAERTARANLAEARSMVAALTPPALSGGTLQKALTDSVDSFRAETGLTATLVVDGTPRQLPGTVEVVLLRTVQEALTNVRRHAGATTATVRLSYVDGQGSVQVTDDGAGFDADCAPGFGLRGMRSRVEQAGGAVYVRTAPGAGTSVTVSMP